MNLETPDDLYLKCPTLQDIANRLDESEKETIKINAENKTKFRRKKTVTTGEGETAKTTDIPSYTEKYPEYFNIVEILLNGGWEEMAGKPKFGKKNFLRELMNIVNIRKPKALRIEIYPGKSAKAKGKQEFSCYLVDKKDPEIIEAEAKAANKNLGFTDELNPRPVNKDTMQLMFDMKIQTLEHKQEIEKLTFNFSNMLQKKDEEISDLETEIEELNLKNAEAEKELSGTAELIEAKQKPTLLGVTVTEFILNGAVELAYRNRFVLKDWGLNPDAIKLAWENKQKLIGETSSEENTEENDASFSEVKNEYAHQSPEHAENAKIITAFVNQLNLEDFKLLYTVLFFCSDDKGALNKEHVNNLIASIHEINKKEEEAQTA